MNIGLTLGGGGAKGFAHLPILEVFDELGLRPSAISGTSIGAILGALYASGMSAREITTVVQSFFPARSQLLREIFQRRNANTFIQLLDPSFKPGSFFKGERVLDLLYRLMGTRDFAELNIPLKIVATDFWRHQEVVFEEGDLLYAIRASMAIPYVFAPVQTEDSIIVDGGLVNNLPFDHLPQDCDLKIAVDIAGDVSTPRNKAPGAFEAIFATYQIMMDALTQQKLKRLPLDIYVRPPIVDVELLEFHKALEVYRQGLAAKDKFRSELMQRLEQFEQEGGQLGEPSLAELKQGARRAQQITAEGQNGITQLDFQNESKIQKESKIEQQRREDVNLLQKLRSRLPEKLLETWYNNFNKSEKSAEPAELPDSRTSTESSD